MILILTCITSSLIQNQNGNKIPSALQQNLRQEVVRRLECWEARFDRAVVEYEQVDSLAARTKCKLEIWPGRSQLSLARGKVKETLRSHEGRIWQTTNSPQS